MVASGPYLLANGNISAFEELLRRAEDDPTVQTLILVCRFIFRRMIDERKISAWSIR